MKTTMKLIMTILILVFVSCEKEEIFEPEQKVQEVDGAVKATAQIGPRLSLLIRQRTHNAAYGKLLNNRTVKFRGGLLSATSKIVDGGRVSNQIWSSPDGSNWEPISDALRIGVTNMVAHNFNIWALGTWGELGPLEAYTSRDGRSWTLVKSSLPFSQESSIDAIVFKGKIFVFEAAVFGAKNQKVYSSWDGINWNLENANAFPLRYGGTPIVFKDTLYYLGGSGTGAGSSDVIWKSTNGRDWSRVSGATPNYLNPAEDFPAKSGHAAVVHDNKVWVTGGKGTGSDSAYSNEVWYSGDMKNWRKYTGNIGFKALSRATLISYDKEMLLLGGFYNAGSRYDVRSVASTYVWSIKPKYRVNVPVEIPRERPRIPRF